MRNPLLFPLGGVVCGILVERWVPFAPADLIVPFAAFSALGLMRTRLRLVCIFLACVSAGVWTSAVHRPAPPPRLNAASGETILLTGCVVEPPAILDDREQFTLELAREARVRITVNGDDPPRLRYGQQVEAAARVRYPRNFRNPGAFDYEGYLARRHVYWTASGRASDVKLLPAGCGSTVGRWIAGVRTGIVDRINALYAADPYKNAMMQALLIGESARVERVWTEHFRRTGTYHALVISGLHISVLAGAILFLTRLCWVPAGLALPFAAALAWLYAFAAGADTPVLRSAAGFTLFLVARFFHRRGRVLNLVAAVALAFLLCDPEQLFEASFQLSFISVAAIAVFALPLMEGTSAVLVRASRNLGDSLRDVHLDRAAAAARVELRLIGETAALLACIPGRWAMRLVTGLVRAAAFVWDSAAVSLAVQLALVLPMIFYFHRLSLSGLTANLIVVTLLTAAVPVGFLAVLTGSPLVATVAGLMLTCSQRVVDWHAGWEPQFRIPDPPLWLAGALALALLLGLRWPRSAAATAAMLTLAACFYPESRSTGKLELTAIDVGQGDSLLVTLPSGERLLVDGGGIPSWGGRRKAKIDIGEDVVSPYLWSRGIRTIDVIVVSHAHDDHMQGLRAIAENFRPRELWGSYAEPPVSGIAYRQLRAGAPFRAGGATIQALAPSPEYQPGDKPANNDSLVLLITHGRHRFLLTGDMEKQTEWELIDSRRLPRADVLKIAHHGSRTSSTDDFVEKAGPTLAILSVGEGNLYRLPNREVVERFRKRHTAVLRTDELGLATVISDGRRLSFQVEQWAGARGYRYTPF
ncbi:MAG TPA: ComEC/Rec2 family competence protein [Bryobacteraceae bacterium]|nr:ComEC/Rec2 family competence protein [Bryobacteraceae bacterium]